MPKENTSLENSGRNEYLYIKADKYDPENAIVGDKKKNFPAIVSTGGFASYH